MADPFAVSEGVPAALTAGATWSLRLADLVEDPAGIAFAMIFTPTAGGAATHVSGVAGAEGVTFTAEAAATAAIPPGRFAWAVRMTRTADGAVAYGPSGETAVAPPHAADGDTGGDRRSTSRRMLDAVEARIEGRITADAESYSIEGRSIARIPFADLFQIRDRLRAEVARETGRGGIVVRPIHWR